MIVKFIKITGKIVVYMHVPYRSVHFSNLWLQMECHFVLGMIESVTETNRGSPPRLI